ncbi:MAG: FAD-binding oxidoreductase [Candidatus Heimdallarchaeota archaeon]
MEKTVYDRLADVVGSEWVSDEPEITVGYSRDLATYARFGRSRSPACIVMPGSTSEVQDIMNVARRFKLPIVAIGTALNISAAHILHAGGILLDFKRMDKILEIDEENCTATIQPYVTLARLSCEMQKRNMFIPIPGAPSTASALSNLVVWGDTHKVTGRIDFQYMCVVGVEMVLPDGKVLRTGSLADVYTDESFWPHGPGPDLWMLQRWVPNSYGVVTAATVRGYPLDAEFKPFWVAFEDIEDAAAAYIEYCREEITTGSSLYGGFKYHYFMDTDECGWRAGRIHPKFMLCLTLQGTKRRVEYEENTLRRIVDKYGGRVLTDRLPFYQMFVDSHIGMAGSFSSDLGATKYIFCFGIGPGFIGPITPGNLERTWKTYARLIAEDPNMGDPEEWNFPFDIGLIGYPCPGGHYMMIELFATVFPNEPLAKKINPRFYRKLWKELERIGVSGEHGRLGTGRSSELGVIPTYYKLAEGFKEILDPEGIMHPGEWLPSVSYKR